MLPGHGAPVVEAELNDLQPARADAEGGFIKRFFKGSQSAHFGPK
jgi:hypothetical protein